MIYEIWLSDFISATHEKNPKIQKMYHIQNTSITN